jgi:hypothetical protein
MKRLFALLVIVIATALVCGAIATPATAGGIALDHKYKIVTVRQDKATGYSPYVDRRDWNHLAFYQHGPAYGYNEVVVKDNVLHMQLRIGFFDSQVKVDHKVPRGMVVLHLNEAGHLEIRVHDAPSYFLVP